MSYAAQYFHVVFSTKGRRKYLHESFEKRLTGFLARLCDNHGVLLMEAGGVEDHLHLLLDVPTSLSTSQIVGKVKANSSRWINSEGLIPTRFAWQEGFSSFSVSRSNVGRVRDYIRNQKAHHARSSYDEELQLLLKAHGIVLKNVPPLRGSTIVVDDRPGPSGPG